MRMLNRFQFLIFPMAMATNLYSVTIMFIVSGIIGKTELAAEMAIIQGGLLAIFMSLSGNARSIILASDSSTIKQKIYSFRILSLIPASLMVYWLMKQSIDVPGLLVIGMILRRSLEWISELELHVKERQHDVEFCKNYIILNAIGLLIVLISLFLGGKIFLAGLFIWALTPIVFCKQVIINLLKYNNLTFDYAWLSPHIGSTAIIGISVYFFRVLIVILAGKMLAGQLFTAFAIGGLINSIYAQALGPTLINRYKSLNLTIVKGLSLVSSAVGCFFILYSFYFEPVIFSKLFIQAFGASLIGGGIMVLAQWHRLSILQEYKMSVFVPDSLANILLLISIPVMYFVFGQSILAFMFLWSSILTLMIYLPLITKMKIQHALHLDKNNKIYSPG